MKEDFLVKIIDRKIIAQKTLAVIFDISQINYRYKAGQYLDLTLIDPPFTDESGNIRTFSIVNSPNQKYLQITTRLTDSAFKKSLSKISLGSKVKISKAMGNFILHSDITKTAVFLMGGIGITPAHAIIEDALKNKVTHRLILFYANRTVASTAFLEDINNWKNTSNNNSNLKIISIYSEEPSIPEGAEQGQITDSLILKYLSLEEIQNSIFYISGPPKMVTALQDLITKELKVSLDNIKTEEFAGY